LFLTGNVDYIPIRVFGQPGSFRDRRWAQPPCPLLIEELSFGARLGERFYRSKVEKPTQCEEIAALIKVRRNQPD